MGEVCGQLEASPNVIRLFLSNAPAFKLDRYAKKVLPAQSYQISPLQDRVSNTAWGEMSTPYLFCLRIRRHRHEE